MFPRPLALLGLLPVNFLAAFPSPMLLPAPNLLLRVGMCKWGHKGDHIPNVNKATKMLDMK